MAGETASFATELHSSYVTFVANMKKRQHIAALSLLLAVMLVVTSFPHHHHAQSVCMAANVLSMAGDLHIGQQSHSTKSIQHHLVLTSCDCAPLLCSKLRQPCKHRTATPCRGFCAQATLEAAINLYCAGSVAAACHYGSPHVSLWADEAFTLRPPPPAQL